MARTSQRQLDHNRAWRQRNPEKWRAIQAAWRAKNPDKIRAIRRRSNFRLKHGIEIGDVGVMPLVCNVCGHGGKICLDHNHETKKVRGWLCDACNRALGCVSDRAEVLRALASYLERY